MNAVHSPDNDDPRISELRVLFETLDRHVAAAFGWADLDVSYDFHEVNASSGSAQWCYSLSEEIREELLRRLVALNKAQHEEEIAKRADAGKSGSGKARGRRRRNSETPDFTLDLDDVLLKIDDRGA